jgi:DHA1 family tetracycline resistance protein-like MFS transporter|tara:strand:- start:4186 stop:5370 length:1185 start_codon:yes stop_codon:yes gene_type:complete
MKPIYVLFLIVFVDLVGFGLLIPLLPFYVQRVGAGPEIITITLGLYSLFQFIAAPIWGRLSDRYGRRPILAWSLAGFAISHVVLGFADSLWLVIVTRIFGGLMAGNVSAAFAYVTDVTTEENRAKGMGFLGAAFGLGFVFGPVIGGLLAGPDVETANYTLPAMFAAVLTTVALIGVITALPESLSPEIRERIRNKPKILLPDQLRLTLSRKALVLIIAITFFLTMAFAVLEVILGLWAYDVLSYGPRDIGLLLTYVGVIGVVVQGGLIGPLTKRFSERSLVSTAVVSQLIGYSILVYAVGWQFLFVAMTLLAIGSGLYNPILSSLVSKEAGDTERGAVLGVFQGASSFARVIGPLYAGAAYAGLGPSAPFAIAAICMAPTLVMVLLLPRSKASS